MGLLDRAIEAVHGYLCLGNQVTVGPDATVVRNASVPEINDANHVFVRGPSVDPGAEFPRLAVKVDPRVSTVEARLVADGYTAAVDVEMVLTGTLTVSARGIDIRPVTSEADWESFRALKVVDAGPQFFLSKRAKAPDVQYFLARVEAQDCGFFSAWPGRDGVGVVEDLFTAPWARNQGVATALIATAVGYVRERGAGPVMIGSDPNDTPGQMYRRMGWEPLFLWRSYRPPPEEAAPR